jgi:hypothetical protein
LKLFFKTEGIFLASCAAEMYKWSKPDEEWFLGFLFMETHHAPSSHFRRQSSFTQNWYRELAVCEGEAGSPAEQAHADGLFPISGHGGLIGRKSQWPRASAGHV